MAIVQVMIVETPAPRIARCMEADLHTHMKPLSRRCINLPIRRILMVQGHGLPAVIRNNLREAIAETLALLQLSQR
jgi:hypothetical protein